MSSKFVYFTDLHLWDRNISTRIDRSSETGLAKLNFLIDKAIEVGATGLLCGGDLTAEKIDSDEYKGEINKALVRLGNTAFATVVGNHDIAHREFGFYIRRTINLIVTAKLGMILSTQFLQSHGFLGISAFDDSYKSMSPEDCRKVSTIFAHHYIDSGSDRLVLSIPTLKQQFPNLRYIFTGHDHNEYPDVTRGGVTIVRPGGALRVSSAKENTERHPKGLIITVHGNSSLSWEPLYLPASPSTEVFDLASKTIVKSAEEQLDEFESSVTRIAASGVDVEAEVDHTLEELGHDMGENNPDYLNLREDILADRGSLLTA